MLAKNGQRRLIPLSFLPHSTLPNGISATSLFLCIWLIGTTKLIPSQHVVEKTISNTIFEPTTIEKTINTPTTIENQTKSVRFGSLILTLVFGASFRMSNSVGEVQTISVNRNLGQ